MFSVVADSSLDRSKTVLKEGVKLVPFRILIDGTEYVDKEDILMNEFSRAMRRAKNFETSCPSPEEYINAFRSPGDIFCITITGRLSGSYNSAVLAKNMFEEIDPDKKIHIFDSKGASSTLAVIYEKIKELIEEGRKFEEIVLRIEELIRNTETMFILDSLENLRKKGRLSNLSTVIAKTLNIYPIMGADDGYIVKLGQTRGKKKALRRFVDVMKDKCDDFSQRKVFISHADNLDEAILLKRDIEERLHPKDVEILPMNALNYTYADYRGLIVAF